MANLTMEKQLEIYTHEGVGSSAEAEDQDTNVGSDLV